MGDRFTRTGAVEARGPRIMRSDFEVREKVITESEKAEKPWLRSRSRSRSEDNTVESSRWAKGAALGSKKGKKKAKSRSRSRSSSEEREKDPKVKMKRQLRKVRSRSRSSSSSESESGVNQVKSKMKHTLKKPRSKSRSLSPVWKSKKVKEREKRAAAEKKRSESPTQLKQHLSSVAAAAAAAPVKASPIVKSDEIKKKKMSDDERSPSRSRSRSRSGSRSGSRSRSRSPSEDGPRKLPIHECKEALLALIAANQVCVITGDTGCGKSTQLAQFLHEAGYSSKGMIGITQPRRLGAVSLAKRVALEMGTELGDTVGFQIRFSDVSSANTAIKFMTDGVLLRECLLHKDMKPYSVIVLDEAHERSLHTDILFGVLRQLLVSKANPNLKVLITSATLNTEQFCEYFLKCPHFSIPGRCFPVDVVHSETTQKYYVEAAVTKVLEIHTKEPMGAVLVFLTGQEQIEEAIKGLSRRVDALYEDGVDMPDIVILPAYANLAPDQVQKIFAPCPPDVRKVVFATNIAETSLTVDGVVYVVDPGYVKQRIFNSSTGIDALTVVPISKVAAVQRAGRAGRTAPGKCYRLYTEKVYQDHLPEVTKPEIQRTNLANTVLMLKSLGIEDPISFEFLDNPSLDSIVEALELLYQLDALTADGEITKLGTSMASFPLEPTLSKLILSSLTMGCHEEMLTITAMLSAEDLWIKPTLKETKALADERREMFSSAFGDHITYLLVYDLWVSEGCDAKWCNDNFIHHRVLVKAKEIRSQLAQILNTHREEQGDTTKDPSRRKETNKERIQQRVPVKRRKGEDEFGRLKEGAVTERWKPESSRSRSRSRGRGKDKGKSRSRSREKRKKGGRSKSKERSTKRSRSRERKQSASPPPSSSGPRWDKEDDVITLCRKCIAQSFFAHTARKVSDIGAYKPYNEQATIMQRGSQLMFMHPTSSLRETMPRWVVYNEVIHTTKAFMKNVCAIEFDWVAEWLPRLTNTSARRLVGKTAASQIDHKLDYLTPAIERLPKIKHEDIHANVDDAKARYLARKSAKEKPASSTASST